MPRSAKGSGYEREVCELLGDWWVGTSDRDRIFWARRVVGPQPLAAPSLVVRPLTIVETFAPWIRLAIRLRS